MDGVTHPHASVQLKTLAAGFRERVEARLALEKELAAAAVRYSGLANEVQFVLDLMEEAIAEPILGNRCACCKARWAPGRPPER